MADSSLLAQENLLKFYDEFWHQAGLIMTVLDIVKAPYRLINSLWNKTMYRDAFHLSKEEWDDVMKSAYEKAKKSSDFVAFESRAALCIFCQKYLTASLQSIKNEFIVFTIGIMSIYCVAMSCYIQIQCIKLFNSYWLRDAAYSKSKIQTTVIILVSIWSGAVFLIGMNHISTALVEKLMK